MNDAIKERFRTSEEDGNPGLTWRGEWRGESWDGDVQGERQEQGCRVGEGDLGLRLTENASGYVVQTEACLHPASGPKPRRQPSTSHAEKALGGGWRDRHPRSHEGQAVSGWCEVVSVV